MAKRKELGKGIRALLNNIEDSSTERKQTVAKTLSSNVAMIELNAITVNPYQPRTEFDQIKLEELSNSIRTYGLIQPVTLRKLDNDTFQLISGERRFRASKMAGLTEVPAYIRFADDQEMLEMALVENIQRADLNAIEIGISYQRLIDECKLTHELMAERVGKNRSTITNYIRLLKLPVPVQNAVKNQEISMGHARALAGIQDVDLQLDIFKTVVDKSLSVRALESLIKSYDSSEEEAKPKYVDPYTQELRKISDKLSHRYGTKATIKRSPNGSGQIVFKFSNDGNFNELIDLLQED